MADIDQYFYYPKFPGMSAWTPTLYERNLAEDYAIADENLPSSSIATRLDILSGEYPVGGWLGVVIPFPSALLVGYNYTTILTMTGKYWNWLSTGYFLRTSSSSENGYSVGRPATFHYQVKDLYKESAHYGFEMILLAFVTSIGQVYVTNIVSFVPFMEHRHQCAFKRFLLQVGTLSSSVVDISESTVTVYPEIEAGHSIPSKTVDNLNILCYWESTDDNTGQKIFRNQVFKVKEITSSLGFVLDVSQPPELKAQVESGLFPNLAGAFYVLDRPVQIEDPRTAYTETMFGREYLVSSSTGYTTREQAVEYSTTSWKAVYYDATLVADYMEVQAKAADKAAESSDDEQVVAEAQKNAARLRTEAKAVTAGEAVYDGRHAAENGVAVTVDGEEVVVSEVVLREYEKMGATTVMVGFDIKATTLSRHNYGPGTQVGSYFMFTKDGETAMSSFKVLQHGRSGIFTLSAASSSSLSTIYESLASAGTYRILSGKLWKTTDICTNSPGISAPSNISLDRGVFDMTIESAAAIHVSADGSMSDAADEESVRRIVLKCKFSDRNYYTYEYLKDRFLADVEEADGQQVVKAWKKFSGWRFNQQGRESSASLEIMGIGSQYGEDDGYVYVVIDREPPAEGDIDMEQYAGNWWISFDSLFSFMKPFGYITTPFIGLNAALTQIGTDAKISFDGIYVGSPILTDLKRNSVIRLIEDNPALFPNVSGIDYSMIKVGTSKAYRYIAHVEDDPDDAEYILYERDDDISKAMYVRSGRMNFTRDINEFLVHHSDAYTDVPATLSGDGATAQRVSVEPASIADKDVIAIMAKKNSPDTHPAADAGGNYFNTIWRLYQGDRLIGIDSTTGVEDTIFTRAAGRGTVRGVTDIPFYATAEYFSRNSSVEYRLAGNTMTDDSLAGDGSIYRFVPVLNPDAVHAKFASASLRTVPSNMVVRNARSRRVIPSNGKNLVCIEQPQWSYLDSQSSTISEVTIVPGTESTNASLNVLPDPSSVSILDNGVFILNTTDSFRTYSSGSFARNSGVTAEELTRSTMWRYPLLASMNLTQCSFSSAGDVDIVGYSSVKDSSGNEVLALVHDQLNLTNSFRNPVFAFHSNGRPVFLWCNMSVSRTLIAGNASTTDIVPGIVIEGLDVNPLSLASSNKYKFLVFKIGTDLYWAMTSGAGKSWSFYDDITLTPNSRTASSPSIVVWKDWLMMCYIGDGVELRFKKMLIPSLAKFHVRYMENMKSSGDQGEAIDAIKQELQSELDNTLDVKITDTFDQQVSFSIGENGIMRVVFFDSDGLVNAATSSTEGNSWNLSPVNF
jgi:hypothetical protein